MLANGAPLGENPDGLRRSHSAPSEAPRHPWPPLHHASRALLIETARRLDALVLRWKS